MKKLFACLAVLMTFIFSASTTPTVTLYQNSDSYYDGGQFTAVTSANGTFQTFCVDTTPSHDFTPGDLYYYSLGNQTYVNSGDYLSLGVSYLYRSFLNGDLAGYTYGSATSAGSLQNLIWVLQKETQDNPGNSFVPGNPFYNDVVNEFGSINTAELPANGAFGIEVMNLFDGNNNPIQSQLVSVNEGGTWLVSLFLLVPLAVANKRKTIPCLNNC